jgi:Flp pilus assembly protein TadG
MRRRDDRGAAAVEFALVLVPLLVVIFGLIQYGLYFYSAQTGSSAVNAAARQLAVGNCQNAAQLQNYVKDQLGAAATDNPSVAPVWKKVDGTPGTPSDPTLVGGTVQLTISFHSINMNFPLVPFLSDSRIDREVTARVEDTTDQGCPS